MGGYMYLPAFVMLEQWVGAYMGQPLLCWSNGWVHVWASNLCPFACLCYVGAMSVHGLAFVMLEQWVCMGLPSLFWSNGCV